MRYSIILAVSLALAFSSCSAKADSVTLAAAKPRENPRSIAYPELQAAIAVPDSRVLIVDVRTREEFTEGHIPGSILFPYDRIEAAAKDFSAIAGGPDRPIVVYCRSGRRSAIAAQSLVKLGYTDIADLGPLAAWQGSLEK